MRTTLSIDDDVLAVVHERAKREGRTAGQVLSDLARESLSRSGSGAMARRNGFPLLPARGNPVSDAAVEEIREQEAL